MSTFPTLIPSTRTFTPGIYPHTVFAGMSGRSNRVRNSNAMLQSQLRLSFEAITEAEMLSILAHYNGQQGSFLSFPLPSAVWSGGTASDFELSGYGWIYREPPTVEDLMCGGHNVELTLETVPPEGTALLGLDLTMRMLLSAGTVATAPGSLLSMTYGLDAGLVGAPGINGTIGYSLTAGTVDSESTDPDFASVSLLLHFDEDFTDSSTNAFTVTANGNAQISTAQSKFGGASGLFDGTGDYITVAPATDLYLTGDFTIECWIYMSSYKDAVVLSSAQSQQNNIQLFRINPDGNNGRLFIYCDNNEAAKGTIITSGTSSVLTTSTWHHLALSRSSGSARLFVDGVQVGSTATGWTTGIRCDVAGCLFNSGVRNTTLDFNGYIDDLRITKGVARYTGNFTPPTAPFPDS